MFARKKNTDKDVITTSQPTWLRKWLNFEMVGPAGHLIDVIRAWRSTRQWGQVAWMFPGLLVGGTVLSLVAGAKLTPTFKKLSWYAEQADKLLADELTASVAADSSSKTVQPTDLSAESAEKIALIFRRVLQIEPKNVQARFYVAMQISKFGEDKVARRMMQEIAPPDMKGDELAHAWLAIDLVNAARAGKSIDLNLLRHHLKHGTSREDASPQLLLLYSQLLQRENNPDEAMEALRRAALADTKLQLNASAVFMGRGLKMQGKLAADTLIASYQKRLATAESEELRLAIAQAYLITERENEAINALMEGIGKEPNSFTLRRTLSNIWRARFKRSIAPGNQSLRLNLDALDTAISVDPTNYDVSQELDVIRRLGIGTAARTINQLRDRLATSGVSYVAHLLLAEAAYSKQEIANAIGHYEIVLSDLPNMSLALNNMAVMLTEVDATRSEEALSMINRAIQLNPNTAEFYDSRGLILLAVQRKADAYESFRKAIELNPLQLETYDRTMKLADELGRPEEENLSLAEQKQKASQFIEKRNKALQEEFERQRAQASPASNASKETEGKPQ